MTSDDLENCPVGAIIKYEYAQFIHFYIVVEVYGHKCLRLEFCLIDKEPNRDWLGEYSQFNYFDSDYCSLSSENELNQLKAQYL